MECLSFRRFLGGCLVDQRGRHWLLRCHYNSKQEAETENDEERAIDQQPNGEKISILRETHDHPFSDVSVKRRRRFSALAASGPSPVSFSEDLPSANTGSMVPTYVER